jgi:hypothetical protein
MGSRVIRRGRKLRASSPHRHSAKKFHFLNSLFWLSFVFYQLTSLNSPRPLFFPPWLQPPEVGLLFCLSLTPFLLPHSPLFPPYLSLKNSNHHTHHGSLNNLSPRCLLSPVLCYRRRHPPLGYPEEYRQRTGSAQGPLGGSTTTGQRYRAGESGERSAGRSVLCKHHCGHSGAVVERADRYRQFGRVGTQCHGLNMFE